LKPGEPRFGYHAALPDDAYTISSKGATQSISELISGAVEPPNLWCIVKHYVSEAVGQILPEIENGDAR
jgi:hypothetical protein